MTGTATVSLKGVVDNGKTFNTESNQSPKDAVRSTPINFEVSEDQSLNSMALFGNASNVSIISGDVTSLLNLTTGDNITAFGGDGGNYNYNDILGESTSRPLSRNSTTSCLSTTATKDGVEGKRLHRHGPTAFANSIIQSMFLSRYQQQSESGGPSDGDKLNAANIELHNSIVKKQELQQAINQYNNKVKNDESENGNDSQSLFVSTPLEGDGSVLTDNASIISINNTVPGDDFDGASLVNFRDPQATEI